MILSFLSCKTPMPEGCLELSTSIETPKYHELSENQIGFMHLTPVELRKRLITTSFRERIYGIFYLDDISKSLQTLLKRTSYRYHFSVYISLQTALLRFPISNFPTNLLPSANVIQAYPSSLFLLKFPYAYPPSLKYITPYSSI